mmetsp:Transcript_24418/g.36430  ORF Transcript_24418/g.36430 Transcript_24418/m.36430 type:complete len:186 (+) Transcript_24418:562-1119(+)
MSKFNPAAWLGRSRNNTNSSGDFSTTTNNESSLTGMQFASQSTLDVGSPSPSLVRHRHTHPHPQQHHHNHHNNNHHHHSHSEGEVGAMNVAGFEIPCTGISIPMPSSVNAGASPATAPPTFSKRSTSAGTAASSTDHEHDNGHDQQHAEDLLRKWKYDDELQLCSKTQKMNMNMNMNSKAKTTTK